MSGVTGIELGPNYCVLVRGGRPGSHRTVSAAAAIVPLGVARTIGAPGRRLGEARTRDGFSRARVFVVPGDAPAAASSSTAVAMVEADAAPLVEAGFEIVSVLSPAQALARVVRARQVGAPAGTAVAALSLNSHGAAIAIVSGTEVLHSRNVEWPLGTTSVQAGARSELLDRYLLVSQLAPQLQHVIDLVRPVHGVTVTSVVACGNLPDLRSIAMLLIEEMDIEVETLDSAELFDPGVAPGTFADSVASLQLAAAVASGENRVPVHAESAPTSETSDPPVEHAPKRFWPGARLQSLLRSPCSRSAPSWSIIQVASSSPARPMFPHGIAPSRRGASAGGHREPARTAAGSHVRAPRCGLAGTAPSVPAPGRRAAVHDPRSAGWAAAEFRAAHQAGFHCLPSMAS